MIPLRVRLGLWVQHALGHVSFPLVGWAVILILRAQGYRIRDMDQIRNQFREITRKHPGPLLICANHLTQVDSVLIDWALASNWTYLRRFRLLPWNIPERDNFHGNLALRALCYLTKCIPIVRNGPREAKLAVFAQLECLLRDGEAVCIFPEGTRSRSGRLDMENFGYGLGTLATRVSDATIVCVYLRGINQKASSGVPQRRDELHVEVRVLTPQTKAKGLRAAREISVQAMALLQQMENRYFEQLSAPASEASNVAAQRSAAGVGHWLRAPRRPEAAC